MTGNRKYRDEDWLRGQYVEKQQSTIEIAEICGCDPQTIGNWLKKHNIKTRRASPAADERLTDPDWLYNEHVEKEHSTTEIANKCDCHASTVRDWFEKHDIENRSSIPDERLGTDNRKYRDEDWLREQYVEKQQSTIEIAEICGSNPQTVGNWLKKHNIKRRAANSAADERLTDPDWLYKEHVEKRHTTTEIADECDCPVATVRGWFEKHDIENRSRIPDERLEDPEWLHKQYVELKKSMEDIGEKCGCSASAISTWIQRHNIETRIPSPPPDSRLTDEAWMKTQYKERGQSTTEIANICNCSNAAVLNWLEKHGIETRNWKEALPTGKEHPYWNGGKSSYGSGWTIRKKRKVRERDDHTCQDPRCSVTQADHIDEYGQKLHVHHLRKARDVDDPAERNAMENLITLCRDCHSRWEKIADAGLVPQLAPDTAN